MPTIYIDHQPYTAREGTNLLQTALELGFNLPFFCWHPAMGSVGACRQCAVKQFKDANDTKGRIVMACMTPAAENTYISIDDPEAVAFRSSVTEWLMANHPHDCPVCDEGGECHLQDMTVMTGHNYRRYTGRKRTFRNQDLGPFVYHEMNRCIQCYRCVRYYRGIAGGTDLNSFALHDTVFFGRDKDGVLESEFAGNLVEVCPTGVFTDKTLRKHYVRKWDIQSSPSICTNCAVGCNTFAGERLKQMRRITARYNSEVNGYFLCDRGRYGYEFVNAETRIRTPRVQERSIFNDRDAAARQVGALLTAAPRAIGIGSPRASLEANYALRALVGADNFYQGIPERERNLIAQIVDILQHGPARSPSLQEIAASDAILVLGEDVSNTAPMIALSLRQAVRNQPLKKAAKLKVASWDDYSTRLVIQDERGPLVVATPAVTRIDDIASLLLRGVPQNIARIGYAIAHELDAQAPEVKGLEKEQRTLVETIATALKAAEHPLVISGTSLGSPEVVQAAASVAWALVRTGLPAKLSFAFPEANSLGLGLMGGKSLEDAAAAVQAGQVDSVIVLENDLTRRMPAGQLERLFRGVKEVVVLDSLENETTRRAGTVLSAGTFAEASGSYVNNEGRVQRFYQAFVPEGDVIDSWRWIKGIMEVMGRTESQRWANLDGIQQAMAAEMPVFRPLLEVAPPAAYRIDGARVPRLPHRASGRTANYANVSVREPVPPLDADTPLAFSMEGASVQPPPALIPRFWAPGWNSENSAFKFQEQVPGPLEGGDPGKRLIEPSAVDGALPYFDAVPADYEPRKDELLAVPLYHVFGSEELSVHTPGVAQLAPQPYLAVNPADFPALAESSTTPSLAELNLDGAVYRLPVRADTGLARGMVGVPVGLPGVPFAALPAVGQLNLLPGGARQP